MVMMWTIKKSLSSPDHNHSLYFVSCGRGAEDEIWSREINRCFRERLEKGNGNETKREEGVKGSEREEGVKGWEEEGK